MALVLASVLVPLCLLMKTILSLHFVVSALKGPFELFGGGVCFSGESLTPESPYGLSAQGSESSVDAESSTAEADQDMPEETGYVPL